MPRVRAPSGSAARAAGVANNLVASFVAMAVEPGLPPGGDACTLASGSEGDGTTTRGTLELEAELGFEDSLGARKDDTRGGGGGGIEGEGRGGGGCGVADVGYGRVMDAGGFVGWLSGSL